MASLDGKSQIQRVVSTWKPLITEETPARFVLMVGAADFFVKEGKKREYPIELVRLFNFLEKHSDKKTYILATDSSYSWSTITNDIENVNKLLLAKLPKDKLREVAEKIVLARNEYDFDMAAEEDASQNLFFHPSEYCNINYLTDEEVVDINFPKGYCYKDKIEIVFCNTNLETSYPKYKEVDALQNLLWGETSLSSIIETCVPKEGTLMSSIQSLCTQIPFQEFYLYNCAWIGGTRLFVDKTSQKVLVNRGKQNRHFELMCELLHIFGTLKKPSFLLNGEGMEVFSHERAAVNRDVFLRIEYEDTSLKVVPLNATTTYVKLKKSGGSHKRRRFPSKKRKTRKH